MLGPLRNLFSAAARDKQRSRPRTAGWRPCVEVLDDRTVPAALATGTGSLIGLPLTSLAGGAGPVIGTNVVLPTLIGTNFLPPAGIGTNGGVLPQTTGTTAPATNPLIPTTGVPGTPSTAGGSPSNLAATNGVSGIAGNEIGTSGVPGPGAISAGGALNG